MIDILAFWNSIKKYHLDLSIYKQTNFTQFIIQSNTNMLQKAKEFLSKHKYKLLAGTTFALAAYAFVKYYKDDTRIRLSAFLDAL